jgi:hypothetical protein
LAIPAIWTLPAALMRNLLAAWPQLPDQMLMLGYYRR